jgi:hypothetical protein
MDSKALIHSILAISTISIMLVTMTSIEQRANTASAVTMTKSIAATTVTTNANDINCQSKKGTANTANLGNLKFAGGKCTGENGGTVAAGGITSKPLTSTGSGKNTITSNDINCQSKKGTANTANLGNLKFAGGKCTGENGGTVAAGGVKSNSGAIGMHGINGPNGSSHMGGFIKR